LFLGQRGFYTGCFTLTILPGDAIWIIDQIANGVDLKILKIFPCKMLMKSWPLHGQQAISISMKKPI
jgi:hypothetical protein